MKNHRKALILSTALIVGATALTGCQTQPEATEQTAPSTAAILPASTGDEAIKGISNLGISPEELGINPRILHDSHKVGFQLEPPQPGDAIAVVHTGMGDFSLRFFPDQAPKAVTNFINLAKDGRYNNTSFHRVINNFIVQGGYVGDGDFAVEIHVAIGSAVDFSCYQLVDESRHIADCDCAITINIAHILDGDDGLEILPLVGGAISLQRCLEDIKGSGHVLW